MYESGAGVGVVLGDEDEDENVGFESGDVGFEDEDSVLSLERGYPGNLIVKSNNDNTGLEETWTKRAIPWTF